MLVIRKYAIPLVRGLKDAGYGVYYLSNYSKKAYDECGESLAFMPYMDGGLVSFRVGKTKPSPEMFMQFLNDFGLKAGECVFVDDTEENVAAARALGMQGIVFEGYDQLTATLRQFGIEGIAR
ncbi:MAG: HAD-IA family hydrolase [Clostridia bacterium]|nr:HAD-IA family hydrolase [Clostridia bacterium]